MGGLFGNIVQASKALMAHQVAIQVTGRNMANVNNPEYARQRVKMGDRYTDQTAQGPVGTGVEVLQVQALRDAFLDAQVIRQASETQSLATQKAILSNFELVLGDKIDANPDAASSTGLGNALDDFFNAFSNFAANPSDIPTRSTALSAAQTLADRVNLADERLAAAQADQEAQIDSDVQAANALLTEIARLNFEIRQVPEFDTGGAINLVDTRQAKLEKLAELVKVDITKDEASPNVLNLSIGGVQLVAQAQVVNQLGYLSQKEAADLSASGSLGLRVHGFEVGQYDQAGNFTPAVVSTGGAAMLASGDFVSGSGIQTGTIVTGKLDASTVQLSKPASISGFVSLTINGVPNARMGQTVAGSKTVFLSNVTGYQVLPGGGSLQGRFQAVFGNPTATYMTAKGLRTQVATLAAAVKSTVNSIYNPASGGAGDLFQTSDADQSGATVAAGSRSITLASGSNNSGLVVGMYVSGDGIPVGATIANLVGTNGITLNVPASGSFSGTASLKFSGKLLDVRSGLTPSDLLAAPTTVTAAGANSIASRIAALRDVNLSWASAISGGANLTAKFGDYARNLLTGLAQTIQTVTTRSDESNVVDGALRIQRDGVSGVSLDEETADLLRFQKAYQANAKVISVIDEMLVSLIGMIR
jgi:flagellar hook-associated protein 1 FlgK